MKKLGTLKLEVRSASGTPRAYPNCVYSTCLKNTMKKSCFTIRDLHELSDIFDFEYRGLRDEGLDGLGAKYTE